MRKEYSTPEAELIQINLSANILSASVTEPFVPEETIKEVISEEEPLD